MPAEGLAWLPRESVLDADEIVRLVRIGVELLGIREVRFTGGEPLVRPDLLDIVAAVAALHPRPSIALTTNGVTLAGKVRSLVDAGLDRVNVSLDTTDPVRFRRLTRRDRHADVLRGLAAAQAAGLRPVKVNAVLMRGVNDDEAADLLAFCLARGYQLRFIEQMPLDADHAWTRAGMIAADEILAALRVRYRLSPVPEERGASPAEHYLVDGGPARVGVIASVTRPFCGDCDRTRITADGQVRNCLFATREDDLRGLLRGGAGDAEIARAWQGAMWRKAAGHGVNASGFEQPVRTMSAIGG
jgi:cyclic pyranopterin phosphate synthase